MVPTKEEQPVAACKAHWLFLRFAEGEELVQTLNPRRLQPHRRLPLRQLGRQSADAILQLSVQKKKIKHIQCFITSEAASTTKQQYSPQEGALSVSFSKVQGTETIAAIR